MILLYSALLLLLGAIHVLVRRRAVSLERKHTRAARAAQQLLREQQWKEGNRNRSDQAQVAKRQFLLGQLVQKADRLEDRHHVWLNRSEWLGKTIARIRSWKGRTLPYTFGAVDVYGVLYLVDRLGFDRYLSTAQVVEAVRSWING